MILKCGLILLSIYAYLPKTYGEKSWNLAVDMDYIVLLYEDACEKNAEAEWNFINNPSNKNLFAWEQAQANYSSFKKEEVNDIHNATDSQVIEDLLIYQLGVAEKPGDMLLNSTDWKKFVSFSGKAAILRMATNHTDGTVNHSRHEIEKLLSGNAKLEDKRSTWSNWHRRLLPLVENYSSTLNLVSEAATANDANDVASYWELLSGYTDGYEKMKSIWERITDLHKKLVTFVQRRLAQKYKITLSDAEVPAYLIGSLDGSDWISIAGDVMPYGNVTYSILKNLWDENLRGIPMYDSASNLGKHVLKRGPVANFRKESKFNQTCSTRLINFCRYGATRVSTCEQASLNNFLTAHKVIAKVLTNQIKAEANTHWVFNMANRYSGLDEGVAELFSIMSVSPGQLLNQKLIDNGTDTEHSKISSLMITALDVLPRLAYYVAADLWRIDVIKNGTSTENELLNSWWEYRKRYERVTTDSSDLPTFLDDEFITSNKPYLPKFVGTILAFQLYQYLTDSTEVRYDTVAQLRAKSEFVSMVQRSGDDDWMKVMNTDLGIYDISETELISFFAPLDEYLENNSDDIHSLTAEQEADLRRLEKMAGSSSVTTTPAQRVKPKDPKLPPKKTSPLPPPEISTDVPSSKDENISTKKPSTFLDEIEAPEDAESNDISSINTSKAVWAVSVVLVATITICIIAIFGRRRCIKSQTPKNRRYV